MIRINKIRLDVDSNFFKSHHIYKIRCDKELWKRIDDVGFEASCGIKENNNVFLYILTDANKPEVRKHLEERKIPYSTISETGEVPLKLIVNSICRDEGFCTVSGANYYLGSVSFYKNEKLKKVIDIPEIWVSHDGVITVHTVRFSKWKHGTEYRVVDDKMVQEKYPDENCYQKRGIKDRKAAPLPYLDISMSGFIASRTMIIQLILSKINHKYPDIHASFEEAEDIKQFRSVSADKCTKMLDENIKNHFADGVTSDVPGFNELYNIPNTGLCRIKLIEEKEKYAPGEDEHINSLDIQHITRPTLEENQKCIARACFTELAIKQDIKGGVDSFSGNLSDEATFFIRDEDFYYVRKQGMYLEFGKFDYFSVPKWVMPEVLEAEESFIIMRDGVIGLEETDLSPMPDERFAEVMLETDGKIRNKTYRNELIGGVVDAHLYKYDGNMYYYSSIIGQGMNSKISKADTFMKLVEYKPCKDYDWILPYVCVTYINAGNRFTKYPYPFKYLREWMKAESV